MPVLKHAKLLFPLLGLAALWPAQAEILVLKNFTLIDGTGRAPQPASALIADNGRITWVGPAAQLKVPTGAQVTDYAGKFVMPGIIDLHVHLGAVVDMVQDAKFLTRENVERYLKSYASYGVTTVQSLGTDTDVVLEMRDKQRAGRANGTRIYSAGKGYVFDGGYGGLVDVTGTVKTVADIEPQMATLVKGKVDIVKLWLDDELGTFPKIPVDMSAAIFTSAKKHGFKSATHIFYLEDAKRVTSQGVTGLAHSVRDKDVDQALIDMMKKQGTWQMAATLSREAAMFAYGDTPSFASDPFFIRGASPGSMQLIKDPARQASQRALPAFKQYPGFLEMAKKNLKKLVDSGVKYGMGTDTGPPGRFPGFGEHWEMELMVQSGLTPMQVIVASTKSGAEFLGAKDLGTIEKSKWADLLVLDADPLANIRNTRSINAVYIAGTRVP